MYMETLKGGTGCKSCGFFKDVNENFLQTITDKEHAPKYLFREMKCRCQKSNKQSKSRTPKGKKKEKQ